MKIAPRDAEAFLAAPPDSLRILLLYGPDEGAAEDRLKALLRRYVSDPSDPFVVSTFWSDALRTPAFRLSDEAATFSLGVDFRVIIVRKADAHLREAVEMYAQNPSPSAILILMAAALNTRDTLRLFCESAARKDIAAVGCYQDSPETLERLIEQEARLCHKTVAAEARLYIRGELGEDRGISLNEIRKLMIYAHNEPAITLEMAEAVITKKTAGAFEGVIASAFEGNVPALEENFFKLQKEGLEPLRFLRALLRHMRLLLRAADRLQKGANYGEIMNGLGIFWKNQPSFQRQMLRFRHLKPFGPIFAHLSRLERDCLFAPRHKIAPMLLLRFLLNIASRRP